MFVPQQLAAQRQGFAAHALRRVILGLQLEHLAEPIHGSGNIEVLAAIQSAAPVERAAQERNRLIVQAEARVDGADRFHERRLNRGLRRELLVDAGRALVHDLPRRDRIAACFARIGHVEQAYHEARGLLGRLCFDLGAYSRLACEVTLLIDKEGGRHRNNDKDRHRYADAAIAPEKQSRGMQRRGRSRRDRLIGKETSDIVGVALDRAVTICALPSQRLRNNCVEITG